MNHNKYDGEDDDFLALVEWELNKRRGRSATYTQPLIGGKHPMSFEEEENVNSFLSEFYSYQIYDNMMNMKHILQIYSDTVAVHYGLLVPNICSFDEFWSRYYYRCSIVQVKKDLIARQQRTGSYTDDYSDSTTNMDHNTTNNSAGSIDVAVEQQQQQPTETESLLSNDGSNNHNNKEGTNSNTATTTTTTNSNNRTQMFYQENDRDIIEVIPEENDDNDNDDSDEHEFDTVCITNDNGDHQATSNVVPSNNHVAIGF